MCLLANNFAYPPSKGRSGTASCGAQPSDPSASASASATATATASSVDVEGEDGDEDEDGHGHRDGDEDGDEASVLSAIYGSALGNRRRVNGNGDNGARRLCSRGGTERLAYSRTASVFA